MKDYGISVLTQYQMEVFGTHKVRGAILCDTDKGLLLLKETRMEESRICALAKIYEQLNANGFEWVDTPLLNKEDAYVSKAEDGTGYILKKWFQGRECDVRREIELIAGAENLARIHLCMRLAGEENGFAGREENPVTIARRSHLFPSRTQKLSSLALMILGGRLPGKVGRCRFYRPYGQAVKTPPFHGGNPGSIPGRVTRLKPGLLL